MKRLLAVTVALGLLCTFPAASSGRGLVERATAVLKHRWIYVDPAARSLLSAADEERLNARLRARGGASFTIVVVPATRGDADRRANAVLRAIRAAIGKRGTYAVVVGDLLVADSTAFPPGFAAAIAGQTLRTQRSNGVAAMLSEFIHSLGDDVLPDPGEPYYEGSDESQQERFLLVLLGVGTIAFVISVFAERHDRRRRAPHLR
jgi:hypothetical protein